MKSVLKRSTACLLLACAAVTHAACSGGARRGAQSRPLSSSDRHWLLVKPSKRQLDRKEIESLARAYKVFDRNEKPSLVDVLEPNKDCRPSPDTEELVLGEAKGGTVPGGAPCKRGIILVPIF
jgi:hypothetical protein